MDELISKIKKNKRKIGIFEIDDSNWKDFGNWKVIFIIIKIK